MSDILAHDPVDTSAIRGATTETEITAYNFTGGTAQQFTINLAEPLVGGGSYTFAGEVTDLSAGSIHGICAGGNESGDLLTETGPFSLPIVAYSDSEGQTTFTMRGSTGCVGRVVGVSLTPSA